MKCAVYHHIKGLGGSIRVSVDEIEKDTEMAGIQMVYHDDTNEIELVCVTKEQINALREKDSSGITPN